MNLTHNAIEYNRPGGKVEVTAAAAANGGVVVEVRDTGIGMPPEVQAKIFERFFRADPSRQATGVHAGLGLAIVKEYVDRLGGKLFVDGASAAGAGSGSSCRTPSNGSPHADGRDRRPRGPAHAPRPGGTSRGRSPPWSAAYWSRVFGKFVRQVGDRQEAEDLAQDVFLRLYRSRKRYRPRAKLATWVFFIARNVGRNALRRRRRKKPHPDRAGVRRRGLPRAGHADGRAAPPPRSSGPSGPAGPRGRGRLNGRQRRAVELQFDDQLLRRNRHRPGHEPEGGQEPAVPGPERVPVRAAPRSPSICPPVRCSKQFCRSSRPPRFPQRFNRFRRRTLAK